MRNSGGGEAEILRMLMDRIVDPVLLLDSRLNVNFANQAARETFGGPPSFADLAARMRPERAVATAMASAGSANGWTGEVQILLAGEVVPFHMSVFALPAVTGSTGHFGFCFSNLSECKRSQALLAEQAKMAGLGQMAAGIAHEINNPLAMIRAKLFVLGKKLAATDHVSGAELIPDLKRIDEITVRIANIVTALQSFSRGQAGNDVSAFDLLDPVSQVAELAADAVKRNEIAFNVEIEPDLTVSGRKIDFMQVLINLVNNSCEAIAGLSEKWIRIEAGRRADFVEITVTDSGPGIPGEIAARIMEPFFTTKGAGKGTGLGLSISKGLMENMGGDLQYDASSANTRFAVRMKTAGGASSTSFS